MRIGSAARGKYPTQWRALWIPLSPRSGRVHRQRAAGRAARIDKMKYGASPSGIGSFQIGDGMAMQLFVRDHHAVIAAAIERDVDRVSERSHGRKVLTNRSSWNG